MKVELITYTQNPEKIIACAGKLCYSDSDIKSLMDNLTTDTIDNFIETLTNIGHESPLEHVSFTFGIEGISRTCSHQLVRHRIASYSQQSQRYVKIKDFNYITPPEIKNNKALNSLYDSTIEKLVGVYQYISQSLQEQYMKNGMDKKSAEKTAIEDARFILPNASETKIIVTMNIRTLLHFFKERCCKRSQWEIRAVANEMLKLCKQVSPKLFAKAGASCIYGFCKEGKMSCGKPIKEM